MVNNGNASATMPVIAVRIKTSVVATWPDALQRDVAHRDYGSSRATIVWNVPPLMHA
jgi:hypothetical protein